MEFLLVVRSGDAAGKKIPVPPGSTRSFGRQSPSDVRLTDDPMISNRHFAVECDGEVCVLRDLGSKFGTLLNGKAIGEGATLRDGDEIQAGRTTFGVQVLGDIRATPIMPSELPPDPPAAQQVSPAVPAVAEPPVETITRDRPTLTERQSFALNHLRKYSALHVVVDAARDPDVLPLLKSSGVEFGSLYEGDEGEELSAYGPWLAKLPPDHPFLETLVGHGWGKSWGVFLTCRLVFAELRRHLRQFLLAKLPDGRQVCFRYYDPRVLRTYMPTCTPEEMARFVGPIERYLLESADEDELLEFGASYRDWKKIKLISE